MTDPVDPIGESRSARRLGRRRTDPRPVGGNLPGETLPVAAQDAPRVHFEPQYDRRRSAFAAFAAHMLGQAGQKRGLKAGEQAVRDAQSSYMDVEWSGPSDRRTLRGAYKKTEI